MKPIRLIMVSTLFRNGHPIYGRREFEITVNEFGEPEIRNVQHETPAQRGGEVSTFLGDMGDTAFCEIDLKVEADPC